MDSPRFLRIILCGIALLCASVGLDAQSAKYIDALKYYQQNDYREALGLFREEVRENPANDAACCYIAMICTADKTREAEAIEWFKRAVELAPDNFWYRYSLATFYIHSGRQELGMPMLEQLIADFPKKSDLYFDLINVYLSENDAE